MTEENTPSRHTSSSLGKHMRNSVFRIACHHDRIFFSGVVRCLFWDEGHEDISAKRVALYVGSGSKNRVATDSRSDSLSTSPRITQGHQGMVRHWEGRIRWTTRRPERRKMF